MRIIKWLLAQVDWLNNGKVGPTFFLVYLQILLIPLIILHRLSNFGCSHEYNYKA